MAPSSNKPTVNEQKKNRRKALSVTIQLVVLVVLVIFFGRSVLITDHYQPLSSTVMTNTDGFIALSYFGVERRGSPKHIGQAELEHHLTVLKEQGFETISQQQIIDFYEKGTPLPEKALFLSFEDGRTDSSIFSQKILERLNYKATMFTYADKMNTRDTQFLRARDLQPLIDSGYWEVGSAGYRLMYINIFNGAGDYLGEIAENDGADQTVIEYYNHYLMDYLRDEYMIPKETRQEMNQRIADDYAQMHAVYSESQFGMPKAYAIMHANTLYNTIPTSTATRQMNFRKRA